MPGRLSFIIAFLYVGVLVPLFILLSCNHCSCGNRMWNVRAGLSRGCFCMGCRKVCPFLFLLLLLRLLYLWIILQLVIEAKALLGLRSLVSIFFLPTTPPSPPTLRMSSPHSPTLFEAAFPLPPLPRTLGHCYCSGHAQLLQRSNIALPTLPRTHGPVPPFSEAHSRQAY